VTMQPAMGSFNVSIGTGPKVTISARRSPRPGNHDSLITLTFTDPNGISPAQANTTLSSSRTAHQGLNGTTWLPIPPRSRAGGLPTDTLTVQYEIAAPYIPNQAPKGDWFSGDNGTYSVSWTPAS